MTISPARALSPAQITRNRYDEAMRVTEAYRIQLKVRKRALSDAPENKKPEACKRVEEAIDQLEAAERAEYSAWLQMEHARQGR